MGIEGGTTEVVYYGVVPVWAVGIRSNDFSRCGFEPTEVVTTVLLTHGHDGYS